MRTSSKWQVVLHANKLFILSFSILCATLVLGVAFTMGSGGGGGGGNDNGQNSGPLDTDQSEITDYFVSQWEITWYFDREYQTGQFANGDYWVIGPVTIVGITPDAEFGAVTGGEGLCTGGSAGVGSCEEWCTANAPDDYEPLCDGEERGTGECLCSFIRNGWEVNPIVLGPHSFDSRALNVDIQLKPALPYTAQPGQSILKTISNDQGEGSHGRYGVLQTASVLTVLEEIPENNGQTLFRPPYTGTEKPLYSTEDLLLNLLPSRAPVSDTPELQTTLNNFQRIQLDHKGGGTGRYLHPTENIPDYGGDIGRRNADGLLRLMLNDSIEDKKPALIAYVQYGIDLYHMALNGHNWPGGGGHRPGQKLPMAFAAVMLDHDGMKDLVSTADFFHEDNIMYYSVTAGRALYGSDLGYDFETLERRYWESVATGNGYRSYKDPYGYIDGGPIPGDYYQFCCTSQPWKGSAIALHIMPELQDAWGDTVTFFGYTDRWVNHGTWTQPDPCAPYDGADGNMDNYGVTFGPHPTNPGDCIRDNSDGTGRFPSRHGEEADGGFRYSNFQAAMWNAYRN